MREIRWSAKFKKDWKNIQKQEFFNREEFEFVVDCLAKDISLEDKYKDHSLRGKLTGTRECHIEPDWLLMYSKDKEGLTLLLLRTGTHSTLFKK